jgi:hypothetical protein
MSFLPGWYPGKALMAGALTTIVQQASATSTASTINAPADIIAGDLILLLDRARSAGSPPTAAIPSGFATISDQNITGGLVGTRQIASYKLADGSEASAVLTGMNGSSGTTPNLKALLVMRGNVPAASLTVSTPNAQATDANPTGQSVVASAGVVPLVVFGCYGADNVAVSPRTMSPAKDGEVNPNTNLYLAWLIQNSVPADVSVDMDDEGNKNILQSFYVAMAS